MYVNYHTMCCGVKELTNLSVHRTPEVAMQSLGKILYPTPKSNNKLLDEMRQRCKKFSLQEGDYNTIGVQHPAVEPKQSNALYRDPGQYSRFRFAIFAEAANQMSISSGVAMPYGKNFAAFILKAKLGEVTETGLHKNPNSGNMLKCWMWAIDHDALRKWLINNASKPEVMGQEEKEWVENLKSAVNEPAGPAVLMPMGVPAPNVQPLVDLGNTGNCAPVQGQPGLNFPNQGR